MLTPNKMSQLSNNEVINSMYTELNNELTKSIISELKKHENLTEYSRIDIKKVINVEKNKILKDSLKKTRNLYRKTRKQIKNVYEELSDALNDNRGNNKQGRRRKQ